MFRWVGVFGAIIMSHALWGQGELAGEWMVETSEFGHSSYTRLSLIVVGSKLTGTIAGRAVEVTVNGNQVTLNAKDSEATATLAGGQMRGEFTRNGRRLALRATRVPERPAQPRVHNSVYLPVSHPGALLYVGDGHAAQGDGELTGDALETSMDVEFTVDVIQGRQFGQPLAENEDYLISVGIGGSLTQALQSATSGMIRWLTRDYELSASESAMVMGFAVKYDVVDLVGAQVSIAAKLPKKELANLKKVEAR